jgi:hypothetical protein
MPFPAKIEYANQATGCARGGFYSLRENILRAKRFRRGAQNEVCGAVSWKMLCET